MLKKTVTAKMELITAMGIFGTIGVFVRGIPLPSGTIALVRGFVGAAFLLTVALLRKRPIGFAAMRHNLPKLLVAGLCVGANWIFLFEAYRHTTVSVATLCYYCAPIFVIFLSPLVLRERLTAVKTLAGIGALCGMVLVSGVLTQGGGMETIGVLFGLGAAVQYAAIILINKRLDGISAYDSTMVQLTVAAVVLGIYVLFTGVGSLAVMTPVSLFLLLILGVVHTGTAYALYYASMPALPAQAVAVFSYVDPVIAIFLSHFVLREKMDAFQAAGAVLILACTLCADVFGGSDTHGSKQK